VSERALDTIASMRRSIGWPGIVEAALSPLLTPLLVVPAWLRSLWAARILLDGRWHRYRGFSAQGSLTSFFYATQWLNISRYGIRGRSPLVALGDFPLSRWFHLTFLSSCLYAHAGAVCTLAGTLAWVLLHLAWLGTAPPLWVVVVTATVFFSSTAFAMAFTRQNYNILGWLWLPLALQAVLTGSWVLAALSFFAAALASITMVFAALPLLVVQAVQTGSWMPLVVLLPSLAKLALHLEPAWSTGAGAAALGNMARMIGAVSVGIKYRRTSKGLRPFTVYFIFMYAVGCALLWQALGPPVLPLAAFVLFVVNQALVRFADEQSVILLFVSVVAAHVLQSPPSPLAWVALCVVANPLPVFLGLCAYERDRTLVRTRTRRPYDHAPLQAALERFLEPVAPGSRVLFAFDDPCDTYERIFDGYHLLLELPVWVASSRGVHLCPDWHAIAETNYAGAPSWWGRSPDEVRENARRLGASHAIVYVDSGEPLGASWAERGFEVAACLDWGERAQELDGEKLWRAARPPRWWLLTVPNSTEGSR
jgi:hypothetical protein